MTEAEERGLQHVLTEGFDAALFPAGFVRVGRKRVWLRSESEISHIVALQKNRGSFGVQWGLGCPEVAEIRWGITPDPTDVAYAIVTGHTSNIRHPAQAGHFKPADLGESSTIAAGVRDDMGVVSQWMAPLRTRVELRSYLMENRERVDRRAFLIPAQYPLKVFTAAALAAVDRDEAACDLVTEAEAEMARFDSQDNRLQLERLRAAADFCGQRHALAGLRRHWGRPPPLERQ